MADFCRQCSIGIFQADSRDLAGLTDVIDTAAGLFASVICEGCGPTYVDHAGRCVMPDCLERHGEEASAAPAF